MASLYGWVAGVWYREDGEGIGGTDVGVYRNVDLDVDAVGILCQIGDWMAMLEKWRRRL